MGHLGWDIKVNTSPAKQGWDINISLLQPSGRGTFLLRVLNRPCAPQAKIFFFVRQRGQACGGMPIVLGFQFMKLQITTSTTDTGSQMQMKCWDEKNTLLQLS